MTADEANIALVRELIECFEAGDMSRTFELLHPEVVWDVSRMAGKMVTGQVYRGHDGMRAFWSEWLSAWKRVSFENDEYQTVGNRVVVRVVQRAVGKRSGVEVDIPPYWTLYDVADGVITSIRFFDDRDEAVAAAGAD